MSDSSLVAYGDSFVLSAILDPNVREGVVSFELRNNLYTEPVFIPWITSEEESTEDWFFEITLDGLEDEIVLTGLSPAPDDEPVVEEEQDDNTNSAGAEEAEEDNGTEGDGTGDEAVDDGNAGEDPLLDNTDESDDSNQTGEAGGDNFQAFIGENGVSLNFPAEWFITESQDGIIDLSIDAINPEVIPIPGENIFATIFSGPAADYGIASTQEVTPQAIKELLLGKVIPSGEGEDAILLTETGLEIISEKDLELSDNYLGAITRLKTPDDFGGASSNAFESIFAIVTNGENVIVMNGYTLIDEPERLDVMEQIASTMRFQE